MATFLTRRRLPLMGLATLLAATACGRKDEGPKGPRPVPVVTVGARKGELEVHLGGLGTVTPLSTVVVKSRVDGHLQRVCIQDGQMVSEGQLLAEIDGRPFQVQLLQAQGQYAKDEAALKNAKADLARFRGLIEQGILSRQQLDTQEALVTQLQGALQVDKAAVESARLNFTYSRITAPISGRVGLRQVDPGNLIRTSDANGLFVITPVQPIHVVFAVPGDVIQTVLQQAKGRKLMVDAFDRDMSNALATGELLAVDNQVDLSTGTVKLKALFTNKDGRLFPNQFVNARLRLESLKDVVLVPSVAVQKGAQGTYLYVVKPDGTADQRMVEVRGAEGETTALGKGVAAGEPVVVEGIEKLRPGAKVLLPKTEVKEGKSGKSSR